MATSAQASREPLRERLPGYLRTAAAVLVVAISILYNVILRPLLPESWEAVAIDPPTLFALLIALVVAYGARDGKAIRELKEQGNRVEESLRLAATEDLRSLEHFVDPRLKELFRDRVRISFETARGCLRGDLLIEDSTSFSVYYSDVLNHFRGAKFYAVASTDEDIWKDRKLYDRMKEFVDTGGTIIRLFAVEDPQHLTRREGALLQRHVACGISVYVFKRKYADAQVSHFLVEAQGRVLLTAKAGVGTFSVVATIREDSIREALEQHQRLCELSRRFPGSPAAE